MGTDTTPGLDPAAIREQALGGPVLGYRVIQLVDELTALRARVAVLEAGETRTEWGEVEYAVVEHHPESERRIAYTTSRRDDALAARDVPDVVEVMQRQVGPWTPVDPESEDV
jgi:hypothetical protein